MNSKIIDPSQCLPSGYNIICKPKYRRRKERENQQNHCNRSFACKLHGPFARFSRKLLWSRTFIHLFPKSRDYRGRIHQNPYYLHYLFSLRYYGRNCRLLTWPWLLHNACDSIFARCLRFQAYMARYSLSV